MSTSIIMPSPLPISFDLDTAHADAFQRLRVSHPYTLFDSTSVHDKQPRFWAEKIVGTGTSTHNPNHAAVDLAVPVASGEKITRRTRIPFHYQPGKSFAMFLTGVFDPGEANCIQRIGLFDDLDGFYFKVQESTIFVVERTSISGSMAETTKGQSSWNVDKLDGTGPSGHTIDISKAQIFTIDMQYLGVGAVRLGIALPSGAIQIVHRFSHANALQSSYLSNPNLPLTYEIENIGVLAASKTLKQLCSTIISEGGRDPTGMLWSVDTDNALRQLNDDTFEPLISIRMKAGTRGAIIEPIDFDIAGKASADLIFRVLVDTVLTSPVWQSVNGDGITEYDVAAVDFSGGYVLRSGYTGKKPGSGIAPVELGSDHLLSIDLNGKAAVMTIIAKSITGGASAGASFFFRELV